MRDDQKDYAGVPASKSLYGETHVMDGALYLLNAPVVIFKTLVPEKLRNSVINTFSENRNDAGYYGSTHICSAIGHVLSAPMRAIQALKHQ
jgi:hypothetical protein